LTYAAPALDTVLEAAGGYAYFLQSCGRTLWEAASEKEITGGDARVAVELGTADLDHGFCVARWQRATPRRTQLPAGDEPRR